MCSLSFRYTFYIIAASSLNQHLLLIKNDENFVFWALFKIKVRSCFFLWETVKLNWEVIKLTDFKGTKFLEQFGKEWEAKNTQKTVKGKWKQHYFALINPNRLIYSNIPEKSVTSCALVVLDHPLEVPEILECCWKWSTSIGMQKWQLINSCRLGSQWQLFFCHL